MSTRRNVRQAPYRGVEALKQARPRRGIGMFRCVYCLRRFASFHELPSHEAICDARFVVRRAWAMAIERAKSRFERTGVL